MVGVVLISHSRALAEALLGLIRQMADPRVPLAVAAGVGEGRTEFGTDAVEVMEAIQSVYSEDGVLVLMDLGSAILSADMARELLPAEMGEKLRFCAAPIVEGAIVAAVQSGLGASLDEVCQEARQALLPKREQLGQAEPAPALTQQPAVMDSAALEVEAELKNTHGLHARPAARFVKTAASFDADVRVINLTTGKGPVSARSLNALATLGAVGGHRIRIIASGAQAQPALSALKRLIDERFGEEDEPETLAVRRVEPAAGLVLGQPMPAAPVSDGIALGPLYVYRPAMPPVSDAPAADAAAELGRLEKALGEVAVSIRRQQAQIRATLSAAQAAIFEAHLLILQDPELFAQANRLILEQRANAGYAWNRAIQDTAANYRSLPDAYLQQRATDVLDVGRQVLAALAGEGAGVQIELPGPVVLYAVDLTPSETVRLDLNLVLGLVTSGGGPTSHTAILARSLGVPAVSGASPALGELPDGTPVALDGSAGTLWVKPDSQVQAGLQAQRETWLERRAELLRQSGALAHTRDGQRIEVVANVGSLVDAQAAVRNGAEGIGLLRTEFLYLTRQTPPTELEQAQALVEIGQAMGDRPVIVRTLDAGGDKELPYAGLPAEANPFLGVRAIRLCLQKPELFLPQLRAILRASSSANLRVMFPMVANLDEVLQAKDAFAQAHRELEALGVPHRWPISTGIMVEVPAAAMLSAVIAPYVDFFSVGTNDLTQYTLAAERGNPALNHLADALHPAVLGLIRQVCTSAEAAGKWVGVCGELAGDPAAAPVLVGLGVKELSLNPAGIPRIKHLLGRASLSEMQVLAQQVLRQVSAPAARRRAAAFLAELEGRP